MVIAQDDAAPAIDQREQDEIFLRVRF